MRGRLQSPLGFLPLPLSSALAPALALVLVPMLVLAAPARAQATGVDERAAPPNACRPEARVQLNLTTWKSALKRASTPQRRAEVLAEMNLALEPDDADTDGDVADEATGAERRAAETPQLALLAIDDFVVPLGSGELPDHVVQVRYGQVGQGDRSDPSRRHRPGDGAVDFPSDHGARVEQKQTSVYLIQVLRPLGGQSWCALGSELSRRDEGASKLETYALGFVHLLDSKTKAIEVEIVETELRHNQAARQYWIADGTKLRKVFDEKVGGMENVDDGREIVARTGKLTLAGSFPRRIELEQITKRSTCDARAGDSTCDGKEQASSRTFMYNGRNYVTRR
jgi:hypothetical protein